MRCRDRPLPLEPRISIVDDDESVRRATESLLRLLGYATESFASAEAFLAAGDVGRFACVIADIKMPGMSGIDLSRLLGERKPKVPVILITAFMEDSLRVRTLGCGAACVLAKPFSAERLSASLAAALVS